VSDDKPKLRAVESRWVEHQGRPFVSLSDPLGLGRRGLLVPQPLAPLLNLCDGTRDILALTTAFALTAGVQLSPSQVTEFVQALDSALLLDNDSFRRASASALRKYRNAPHRRPALAGRVYPADPGELADVLDHYCERSPADGGALPASTRLRGMVCPHIDYERGNGTYARLWQRCAPALEDVELVIVLGTDHAGGLGTLTPTRQDYATPFGVLPTDRGVVDGLADVLRGRVAFSEELHHVEEHSIELAAVWLHRFMGGRARPIVPVLCGSFYGFTNGGLDPAEDEQLDAAVDYLRRVMAGRKTLVIAAGDLAHVGPNFGDAASVDGVGRAALAAEDAASIDAIRRGDAAGFFELSRAEGDRRRICGLSPIYLMLRLLGPMEGESMGYDQCPADVDGGSLVSIVGALLYETGQGGPAECGSR
jgi:AmmeMemoRadiSam system protein B